MVGTTGDFRTSGVVREQPAPGRMLMLEAARRRFLTEGYAAASMADIAADAGVTKAALYYHFPGKDALFVAVLMAEVRRVRAGLDAIAGTGDALADTLVAIAEFAFREAGDGVVRLLDDAFRNWDGMVQYMNVADCSGPMDVIVSVVARHREELRPGLDPAFVAEAFFGMVTSRMQTTPGQLSPEPIGPDVASAIVDLLLRGARAS